MTIQKEIEKEFDERFGKFVIEKERKIIASEQSIKNFIFELVDQNLIKL